MEQPQPKKTISKINYYFMADNHFKAILALKELSYEVRKRGTTYKKTRKDYIFREPEGRYGYITTQGILYKLWYPTNGITCDVYSVKPYEIHHAHELFTPWGHIRLLPLNLGEIKEKFLPSFKTTFIKAEQEKDFTVETYLVNEVRGISLPSDTKEIIGYCLNTDEFNLRHKTLWPAFVEKYTTDEAKPENKKKIVYTDYSANAKEFFK